MITDRTKLKLDREVGGGDFSLNCGIDLLAKRFLTYQISYPYGGTINFKSVSRLNSEFANLRFEELLKLQLRLMGISDIEGMKL